jgi:hypothetical protein
MQDRALVERRARSVGCAVALSVKISSLVPRSFQACPAERRQYHKHRRQGASGHFLIDSGDFGGFPLILLDYKKL